MRTSKFPSHGRYEISVQGQVLIASCWGSWNIEMHQEASRRAGPVVEKLSQQGPWGCVTVLNDSLISSLEVLQAGRDAVAAIPDHLKLSAFAWVIPPEIEGYSLMVPRYAKMYEGLLETRVFSALPEAMTWVEEALARQI